MRVTVFIAHLVILAVLWPVERATGESEQRMREKVLKIGHQGANGYMPGNTLGSFRRAVELGVDMVELDVHLSADSQLVVIHDNSVDRTTDGSGLGLVGEMTLAELWELDAGGGEKIPTLSEVLEMIGARCGINVELKGPGTAAPVAAILARFVRDKGIPWDNFQVSSFDHAQLAALKEIEPRIRRGPLFGEDLPENYIGIARSLGAWSVNLHRATISSELVERCHREGLRVLVYTVNEPAEIKRMKEMGVDGIFCDYPDRL